LRIRPSFQERKIWIDLLCDLKVSKNIELDIFLQNDFCQGLYSHKDEEKGRNMLYALRNPQLAAFKEERKTLVKELSLPKNTFLCLKENLEDTSGRLDISFKSPEDLSKTLKEMLKITSSHTFYALWNQPWKEKP
jgi:hypothetical protein